MAKRPRPGQNSESNAGSPDEKSGAGPFDSRDDGDGRFPVVIVGASAGGLNPLIKFFQAVPADSGMAFLIIQHRRSDGEGALRDLIARQSTIPVVDAEQGRRVKPDRAYVIPPRCDAALAENTFELASPDRDLHQPIDFLLRSAAAEAGPRAIAVILSGTGSDGTLGVRSIKAEGGFVAVQQPNTAEYPAMPENAIATDEVDLVAAPADIPAQLADYARRAQRVIRWSQSRQSPEAPRELRQILSVLRERRGHDFSHYKVRTVVRRIERRMAVHQLDDYRAYLRLLRSDADEVNTLFRELLIRVSGFFRDPEAFAALEKEVIPKLVEREDEDHPIRVWVPGCSTGEEAYSIAILLHEEMQRREDHGRVQIFATDIDAGALAIARAGRYPASIALDVPEARLGRYFRRSDSHYEIAKNIREMLVFAEQSLIKDPPFSSLDLVSCRNLLIYLDSELQKRIFPLFHYALQPGGFLFLGTSESLTGADEMFRPVDRKAKVFVRRDGSRPRTAALQPLMDGAQRRHGSEPAPQDRGRGNGGGRRQARIVELAERILLRDHVPACVIVDGTNQIAYFRGRTGKFLEPATGEPSLEIMRMIRTDLSGELRVVLRRARHGKSTVRSDVIEIGRNGGKELVRLRVTPIHDADAPPDSLLVAFEEVHPRRDPPPAGKEGSRSGRDERRSELERELAETREDLRATVEELESSNEELQSTNEELQSSNEELESSNEELQSSNEELETSREELQSVNEELHTLNGELEVKVEQLSTANDDINNLLSGIDIGIIFLDLDLRIKRFNPAIQKVIPLIEPDSGRPLNHFVSGLISQDLSRELEEVLRVRESREKTVQGQDGHWYLMQMRPYWTGGDQVAGAVLAFVDISENPEQTHLAWLKNAFSHCPGMVVLTDLAGCIEYANAAFCEVTGFEAGELAGKSLHVLAQNLGVEDEAAMRASLQASRTWSTRFRCHRKREEAVDVCAVFAPICGAGTDVSHAVIYLHASADEAGVR